MAHLLSDRSRLRRGKADETYVRRPENNPAFASKEHVEEKKMDPAANNGVVDVYKVACLLEGGD